MFKKNKIIAIFGILFLWRVMLFVIAQLASELLPYKPSFPYATEILSTSKLPQFIYSWANFDGVHYLTIIEKGYIGTGLIQAFFPFFPFLIKSVEIFFQHPIYAGLTLSFISFFGAAYVLYLLSIQINVQNKFYWIFFGLLLYPSSLFFGAFYTEALFLFLVLHSFYRYHRKQWFLLSLTLIAATATRIVGIFLIPVLLYDYLKVNGVLDKNLFNKQNTVIATLKKHIWPIMAISSGCFGIGGYMLFLNAEFADPLYFFHVQTEFGGGRSEQLVLLPQVVWRWIKILHSSPLDILRYPIFLQEFLAGTIPFFVLFLMRKKVPHSWLHFSVLALILPTLTGSFSSMMRYTLVAFPIYFYIGEVGEKYPKTTIVLLFLSTIVLIFNTILFIQGYWVA